MPRRYKRQTGIPAARPFEHTLPYPIKVYPSLRPAHDIPIRSSLVRQSTEQFIPPDLELQHPSSMDEPFYGTAIDSSFEICSKQQFAASIGTSVTMEGWFGRSMSMG